MTEIKADHLMNDMLKLQYKAGATIAILLSDAKYIIHMRQKYFSDQPSLTKVVLDLFAESAFELMDEIAKRYNVTVNIAKFFSLRCVEFSTEALETFYKLYESVDMSEYYDEVILMFVQRAKYKQAIDFIDRYKVAVIKNEYLKSGFVHQTNTWCNHEDFETLKKKISRMD